MFHALSWFVIVALLTLWSLAAWALHPAATWTASNAGAFSGSASGVRHIRLPDGLVRWVPPEIADSLSQLPAALGPVVDGLLQAAPTLAGGVAVVTWGGWGVGSVLLGVFGALCGAGTAVTAIF